MISKGSLVVGSRVLKLFNSCKNYPAEFDDRLLNLIIIIESTIIIILIINESCYNKYYYNGTNPDQITFRRVIGRLRHLIYRMCQQDALPGFVIE